MKKASEIQSHYEEGAAPAWRICQQPTVVAVAKVSAWLFLLLFLLPRGFQETVLHHHSPHTKPDLPEQMFDSQ